MKLKTEKSTYVFEILNKNVAHKIRLGIGEYVIRIGFEIGAPGT